MDDYIVHTNKNLKGCPHCFTNVDKRASRCYACRSPLEVKSDKEHEKIWSESKVKAKRVDGFKKIGIVILIVSVLLIIAAGILGLKKILWVVIGIPTGIGFIWYHIKNKRSDLVDVKIVNK